MTLFHCNHLPKEISNFFIYLWGGESVICEVLVQGSMTEILFCPDLTQYQGIKVTPPPPSRGGGDH